MLLQRWRLFGGGGTVRGDRGGDAFGIEKKLHSASIKLASLALL
jgi:hypothetical protein